MKSIAASTIANIQEVHVVLIDEPIFNALVTFAMTNLEVVREILSRPRVSWDCVRGGDRAVE